MTRILLCSDGSPYTRACCEYGSWLLSLLKDAQLDILYVSDLWRYEAPFMAELSGSLGMQPYQAILSQLEDLEKRKARVLLESALSVFEKAGQSDRATTHHKTGLLVDILREFEKPYQILMMGKRGENSAYASDHIGSTVERVVRASSKPCLVTSRKFEPIEKIALAFDGGNSGYKALNYMTESGLFCDLEIHLVTVPEDKGEDFALHHLREAEQLLRASGMNPVCQMIPGIPEDVISQYVDEAGISMLFMGAYGHSRIRRLLIGSTTTEMIRRCKLSVMLFR